MLDIIKVELYRLKKSVLFWVMFGISAAIPLLNVLLTLAITAAAGSIEGGLLQMMGLDVTSSLLQQMTQVTSDAMLLALITAGVVLSREFVDGTMRNVVLANKTRAELYFSYLITALFVAVTYMSAFFVTSLLFGATIFGFGSLSAGEAISACLCSFALGLLAAAFVQSCVCMFLFGVRKQWATILFPILICIFAPSLVQSIIQIISMVAAIQGNVVSTEALRWIPFVNMMEYNPANIDGVIVGMNVLYMCVFTAVFVVSGYYTFKKADLK